MIRADCIFSSGEACLFAIDKSVRTDEETRLLLSLILEQQFLTVRIEITSQFIRCFSSGLRLLGKSERGEAERIFFVRGVHHEM